MSTTTAPNTIDILARTAWGEARGDGKDGMQAVINVVCNRANNPRWWGDSILTVCLKPWQFSTWNAKLAGQKPDANYEATMAVTIADPQFAIASNLAALAVQGVLPDITGGADSYYDPRGVSEPPAWATPSRFTVQIGMQLFYRVELSPVG